VAGYPRQRVARRRARKGHGVPPGRGPRSAQPPDHL